MCRFDSKTAPAVEMLALELTSLLQQDSFAQRLVERAVGGEDGWRSLVTPVWLRLQNSRVDFHALDSEQRRRFLKRQVRWAIKDLLRGGGEVPTVASHRRATMEPVELADPSPTGEGQWTTLEDRQRLEQTVREAWVALPPFERAILALYSGQPCEHDATVHLASKVGLGIGELIRRTRSAAVLRESATGDEARSRGGRRGRQGALAEILGVSPGCIHQWACRARNLFRKELRNRCSSLGTSSLPPILERVLG